MSSLTDQEREEMTEKLLAWKKVCMESASDANKLEGQLEAHMNTLKEMGCADSTEAKEKNDILKEEYSKLSEQIREGVKEIDELRDWNA